MRFSILISVLYISLVNAFNTTEQPTVDNDNGLDLDNSHIITIVIVCFILLMVLIGYLIHYFERKKALARESESLIV